MSTTDTTPTAELYGPPAETAYYGYYRREWIDLCDDLKHSDRTVYGVIRSLVYESRGRKNDKVYRLSLNGLCQLIPGANGRQITLGGLRDSLRRLSHVGLVSDPDGQPLTTSSRAKAAARNLRMRVHDTPCNGYAPKWQNTQQKVDALTLVGKPTKPNPAGWESNPEPKAGWESNPTGWESNPTGWESNPDAASTQVERESYYMSCNTNPHTHHQGDVESAGAVGVDEGTGVCVSDDTNPETPVAGAAVVDEGQIAATTDAVVATVPVSVRPRITVADEDRITRLVADLLTAGHTHQAIVNRVTGATNTQTIAPGGRLIAALTDMTKRPAQAPTAPTGPATGQCRACGTTHPATDLDSHRLCGDCAEWAEFYPAEGVAA